MIKTQIFMAVTAFISIVCFNFNKIITQVMQFICLNVYDDSVITWGPYHKSLPIIIHDAYANADICTNKLQLLANWKWDFDVQGLFKSDLNIFGSDVTHITIMYSLKYNNKKQHTCVIDLKNNTINIKNITKHISFDEVRLLAI